MLAYSKARPADLRLPSTLPACSLLAVAISVCMLSDANAEIDRFQSPYSGSSIFADELNGATIGLKDFVNPGLGFAANRNLNEYQLSGAPSGLTISSRRVVTADDELFLTFSCTGACLTVSSDTSVTIQVKNTAYVPSSRTHTVTWYNEGSFTIKPNPKALATSTPTNSSTVTEAGSTSTFTVRLRRAPSATVTVAVSSGDTTEGSVSPNTLTFTTTTWSTAQTVTVTGTDDNIQDGSVNWNVVLNPASSGDSTYNGLSNVNVAMTTSDDEGSPSFSIDSPSVTEGNAGHTDLVFTVTMSPASSTQYRVSYASTNAGTATRLGDYLPVQGRLTFPAGTASRIIRMQVTGDMTDEPNETIVISLSNASSGSSIGTASGTGTIIDDDPNFSIDSPSVAEGDSGSVDMTFTVTLSASYTSALTVDYADAGTGTATSGTDYTAVASGTLTFAAGETSKTITVPVTGDTADEGASETVVIMLSNATAGTGISTATGTGTITDNDPQFSIDDASVTEGDSNSVNMTFTVTLSGAGSSQYTVAYASSDGTATSADYTAVSGTLTFAAGTTSQTFTVSVTGDTVNEANETLTVTLSNPSAGTSIATASATGTITDNDTPSFSIDSPSVTEGDSGSVTMTFTVSLNPAGASQHTVDYSQTGGTASSGTDYTAVSSGRLTFAAGTTSQTITVSVRGDTADEGASETVVLTLSSASSGSTIGTATGTGTITDDDPKFSINSPSVTEGDSSSKNMTFTVSLSAAGASQYTVDFADAGTGSATSADYTIKHF